MMLFSGNLHKLNGEIKVYIKDNSGRTIEYQVYDKYIVEPTDTSCTSQLTKRQKRNYINYMCKLWNTKAYCKM